MSTNHGTQRPRCALQYWLEWRHRDGIAGRRICQIADPALAPQVITDPDGPAARAYEQHVRYRMDEDGGLIFLSRSHWCAIPEAHGIYLVKDGRGQTVATIEPTSTEGETYA